MNGVGRNDSPMVIPSVSSYARGTGQDAVKKCSLDKFASDLLSITAFAMSMM